MSDEKNNDPMTPYEYDTRMIEWNLKHNVINREGIKAHLNSLPDEAANSQVLSISEGQSN